MFRGPLTKLILIILLSAGHSAFSYEQPTLIEIKAKLEEAITRKYQDRISTQLKPDLFSVGAQVTMTVKKEMVEVPVGEMSEESRPVFDFSDLPADIALGIMSPTLKPTAKGTNTLKNNQIMKERIKVTQIIVHVGLSPKLGKPYRDQFTKWLNANIKSEFAEKGKTTVSDITEIESAKTAEEKMPTTFELKMQPKAIDITVQEPTKPRPLGWEERFGQFQNFIGMSILAIFLMLTYLGGKFIQSKDVKAQVAVAEKMHEIQAAQVADSGGGRNENSRTESDAEIATTQVTSSPQLTIGFESFQEQQRKVAFLALSSKENMAQVTQIWLDDGELGRSKIALVLDCVLANLGNIELAKAGNKDFTIEWTMPESIKNDKGLSKAFKAVALMDIETKFGMLDRAYWDLLSIRTLGANLTKQRFSAFAQLSPSSIHKILSAQDRKVKSVTCLHLPPEKLKQVISTMSIDEKKTIVEQAFNYPDMSFADLDFVDNHLNVLVQMEQMQNVNNVELPRLVPGLLAVISPLEEIQLVNQVLATNQDSAFFLKQNYPSIAFLGEWPQDKLKMLLGKSRNLELLAIIQTIPEIKEAVLNVLPARARTMLADDLQSRVLSEEDVNANLTDLRSRLNYMYENNEIDLLQIFNSTQNEKTSVAA